MTMTPSEEYFLKVRNKLDDLGYLQPLSFESVMLVDKLLEDLLETKNNLQHYKNVAHQSMEACSELRVGVGPYKEDNTRLVRENNELRQKLLKAREAIEDTKVELGKQIRKLERERALQDYLCNQHASKISRLQAELARKSAKLMECKAGRIKRGQDAPRHKESNIVEKVDSAQEKINSLTKEIAKLKNEQQELDEVIECLKNKVNARDAEIERLNGLLADGRPLMPTNTNVCSCCSPQLLDCRLLAKNKELSDQLEESKQKQHEAMVRALELAERNQRLEARNMPSARSNGSQGSKSCCCAENAKKICKLQEKLEERILQVEKLEQELSELRKAHAELRSDKQNVDKILELTLEDKKKMNDRVNELAIIEHDLMLEIERLKRTNASQKSQLAELEDHLGRFEEANRAPTPGQTRSGRASNPGQTRSARAPNPGQTRTKPPVRPATTKPTSYASRAQYTSRPPQPVQKKVTVSKPIPLPPKPAYIAPPPNRPNSPSRPATATDASSFSPRATRRAPAPSSTSTSPSPPPDLREQLTRERKQFQQQLEEMERQQAEHCAKFHPPSCPRSASDQPTAAPQKEVDSQSLLLERIQAERDYYHKEFTRLRDQLCNIPDHTAEASTGTCSPHEKLEKLLSERDFYHKEMCRLQDAVSKSQASQLSRHEYEKKLAAKEDEINVLHGKVADLQHKLVLQAPDMNSEVMKKISAKEVEIQALSNKIRDLENHISTSSSKMTEELRRKLIMKEEEILNLRERLKNSEKTQTYHEQHQTEELRRKLIMKEEEILNLRERLKNSEKTQTYHEQHQQVSELWRKLNLKEEEILTLREKIRDLERNMMPMDFALNNAELWRKLHLKEDELSRMQEKIRNLEQNQSDYSLLKRKYNQKEEENLSLREQIRECNRCNSNGVSQALVSKLEMEKDAAKGDCVRLREENNALRDDIKRMKEHELCEADRLEQAKKDFERCVSQFEVERYSLNNDISRLTEELKQSKERARELQNEVTEQRTRTNHYKMVNEQSERELRTTKDLLHQTEAELANALDRVSELNDELHKRDRELKEARQEKSLLKANLTRLDQEKDTLLLKLDEKTEQNVRLEGELDNRDRRIASLEGFVADLQKKLDVALDTAAHSEHSSRQLTQDNERLRKELDKMERCRDNAVREISRLQDDLAALTADHTQTCRCLESARREVEDLKLQVQGYVAEVRRITDILEEKEAERTAMLEHFRTLTVESANLESNNHSLESEARSTKSNLREAQTRIQDLEATLEEKKALVQGYEKQIRELTQQVAKLERKLDSQSRTEGATRDLSRELESQKHCLAQQVEQLTLENKRLEEEVCGLREELSHLHEQLGKERKNSATLEKVLASSRQETLQRTRDNSELQAQVQCMQDKLRDLQDKLEHGSDALRRCQAQCADYQTQVTQLRREITNERFQRARMDETRKSRSVVRECKQVRSRRARSLTCLRARHLTMSPSYVCPCCFLNRISFLRETDGSKEQLEVQYKYRENTVVSSCEALTAKSNTTVSTQCLTDASVDNFNQLQDILEKLKSGVSINSGMSNENVNYVSDKNYISESSVDSTKKTMFLAEQIDHVLREQKRFLRELNLDVPIYEDEWYTVMEDQDVEQKSGDNNWSYTAKPEKIKKEMNSSKEEFMKILKKGRLTDCFFAGGDKNCDSPKNTFHETWGEDNHYEGDFDPKINKPTMYFNEEPVKLPKPFQCTLSSNDSNFNKDYVMDKNISVKLLFFPEVTLKGSSTSVLSDDCISSASVYVTAANSIAEQFQPKFTAVDSNASLQLKTTQSSTLLS